MIEYFTNHDIVNILDVKKARLRQWLKDGFIKSSQPSSGQGKANFYSRQDLYAIEIFRRLVEGGYKRGFVRSFIDTWYQRSHHDPEYKKKRCAIIHTEDNQDYMVLDKFSTALPFDWTLDADRELGNMIADTPWTRLEIWNIPDIVAEVDKKIARYIS